MFVATVIVSMLLAALLGFSAFNKLTRRQPFVDGYLRVGVPEDRLPLLAVILLAGAAGLLVGLVWPPAGIAAAIGLVCYFGLAILAHLRANDVKNLPAPVTLMIIAIVALVLRVASG